ncbi:MAG: hypothetical protein FD180_2299 [Planctomycetota bacterium]|nr:MAG: hypothetical protein FD180_2299 [Planctomycetota bacterium]
MDAPTVAVSDDGKKFAVGWMGNPAGKDRDVFWTVSAAGGQLPPEVLLPAKTDGIQGHPSAGADSSGVFYIAWEDAQGGKGVWLLSSAPGAKQERLSAEGAEAAYPSVSAGKSVGVVWEQGGNAEFRRVK